MNSPSPVLRAGVIGLGPQMVQNLIPALRNIAGVDLVAFCDVAKAKSALAIGRNRSRSYEQYDDLFLEEKLDFVVCASLPSVHEAILERASIAGVSAFVEKPAARSRDTLHHLIRGAELSGTTTGVGFNFRHCFAVDNLIRLLSTGQFGKIGALHVRYCCKRRAYDSWKLPYARAFLLAEAVHAFDLAQFLAGPLKASSSHYLVRDAGAELNLMASSTLVPHISILVQNTYTHFSFEADVVTTTGHNMRLGLPSLLELSGSGIAGFGGLSGVMRLKVEPRAMESGLTVVGYQPQLTSFVSAVRRRAAYGADLRAFLGVLNLVDTVETSARESAPT
jgi:phthalate 4,5-cis-dihydrodiol dehydrogenase